MQGIDWTDYIAPGSLAFVGKLGSALKLVNYQ